MSEHDELEEQSAGSERLRDALLLAARAHEGQVDKLGEPYMSHVDRVMRRIDDDNVEAKMVAALHDVVEDTTVSLDDLRTRGFPSAVIEAVDALTKRHGEPYGAYLDRVASSPLATLVKAADLCDNSDEERLSRLSVRDADRLRAMYSQAVDRLGVGDQIAAWRSYERAESLTTDAVLNESIADIDGLADRASADAAFDCSRCGAVASRLTLVGGRLIRSGFLGSASFAVAAGALDEVSDAIRSGDMTRLRSIDSEFAPFWCGTCLLTFCEPEWSFEVVWDDGFYDATYGRCPNGHTQKVDD